MLRGFLSNSDSNFAILTAVLSVPLMAAVAGVIDYSSASNKAHQLQAALDTSALAIATRYDSGMSDSELSDLGKKFLATNGIGLPINLDEFSYRPSEDLSGTLTVSGKTIHVSNFGYPDWSLERQSTVRISPGPPACVLALDRTAASAVKLQGSANVSMKNCVLASNSKSSTSIVRGGAAKLQAECVVSTGGTNGISGSSNVDLECPQVLENQYPSLDPLAGVVPPSYSACQKMPGGKTVTLTPGTYCNKTFSGDITLTPGTYILRGGKIQLGGNGSLVGAGVTIFLMEGAELTINGNQLVDLSPPTSGPYAGITIYQERPNTETVQINGTAGSLVTGFVYAPGAHIFYAGNATTAADRCIRLVGRTIELTGNSEMDSDCAGELGERETYAGRVIVLVR